MDFQSSLGFSAEDALKTLKLLDAGFTRFTANLEAATKSTGAFNSSQTGMEQTLLGISKAASGTVKELLALADAEAKAAAQAKKSKDLSSLTAQLDARKRALQISKQLVDQLGADRSGASVPRLVNFDASISAFQKLVAATGTSAGAVKRILGDLSASYVGADRKIRDAIVDIIKNQRLLGGDANLETANFLLRTMGDEGQKAGKKITDGLGQATAASNGLFLSWQSVTRIFVGQTIFRAISAITSEISNSVNRAKELEILFAQIRTIAPTDLKIGGDRGVADITRNLSDSFGVDQAETARAVYEAFSNQVGTTAETINFLNETTKLSIATMSDQASTARAVSAVMKGYGLAADQTAKVTDLLFRTIDISAAKMDDLANAVGRVTPLTKVLGGSLEEMFAAFATLNIQGVDTDTALTQLLNVMKGLVKPSEALAARFKEMGVASAEVGVAQFGGIVNFLKEITKNANGVAALGTMFDDIRELQGILGLLNNDAEIFTKNMEKMGATARANQDAFNIVDATTAQQFNKSVQQFRNTITENLGRDILTVLNEVIKAFGGGENAARALITVLEGGIPVVTALIGGQMVKSIATATSGLISFASAGTLALGPLGALAAFTGFAAVGGGLVYLISELNEVYDATGRLETKFKEAEKAAQALNKADLIAQQEINRKANEETSANTQSILTALAARKQGMTSLLAEAERLEDAITKNLREQVQEREKLVDQFLRKAEDNVSKSTDRINKIGESLKDFELKFSDDRFERNLKAAGDDIAKKAGLLQSRIAEFRKLSQAAGKTGNFDDAESFNDEAVQRAKQLADLPKQRATGESILNQLLKERQGLAKTEIASEISKSNLIKQLQPELQAQASTIKELVSQYEALSKAIDKTQPNSKARDDVSKDLGSVAAKLQEELVKFADKAPKGVADNLIEELKRAFTTVDKQEVTLDFLTSDSLNRVQQELDKKRFSASLEMKITEITGIAGGADQADKLSTEMARLDKEIKSNREKASGLSGTTRDAQTAQKLIQETLNSLKQQAELARQGIGGGVVQSFFQKMYETLIIQDGDDEKFKARREAAAEKLKNELSTLETQINEAVQNLDLTKLSEIQKKLVGFAQANEGNSFFQQFIDQIVDLNSQIAKFQEAASKAQGQIDAQKAVESATKAQQKLKDLVPELQKGVDKATEQNSTLQNMGAATTTGVGTATAQLVSLQEVIVATTNKANAMNAALAAASAGGGDAQTAARGGLIHYKANGGFIPKGTDTVPAMLSPGEFVVNAAATRRFYSELVAINSGRSPIYREQGGIVNNTFGDLNINLPAGSTDVQARAFMKKVQRELRRGSSRL
jgi:TP901 family phage tail tape measure protein